MPTLAEALEVLDRAERALHSAAQAVIQAARVQAREADARTADDDEWTRMPAGKARCNVSGWSRSTLIRRINDPEASIRGKTVKGSAYYSAADLRRYLANH